MKPKRLFVVFLLLLCVLTTPALAQSKSDGVQSAELKAQVTWVQQEFTKLFNVLKHAFAGKPGPQGPKGDPGPVGPQGPKGDSCDTPCEYTLPGAGNIAFVAPRGAESDWVYVLTTNGQGWFHVVMWSQPQVENGWARDTNADPPIPVSEIVSWDHHQFLDRDGNLWIDDGGGIWTNVGSPPVSE